MFLGSQIAVLAFILGFECHDKKHSSFRKVICCKIRSSLIYKCWFNTCIGLQLSQTISWHGCLFVWLVGWVSLSGHISGEKKQPAEVVWCPSEVYDWAWESGFTLSTSRNINWNKRLLEANNLLFPTWIFFWSPGLPAPMLLLGHWSPGHCWVLMGPLVFLSTGANFTPRKTPCHSLLVEYNLSIFNCGWDGEPVALYTLK